MAFDKSGVLWFSAGPTPSDVVGWFDTKKFDATHDAQAAQGWTVIVADTNGSHKRDAYVEPDAPVDMTKDKRFRAGFYGVAVSPSDDAIWGSVPGYQAPLSYQNLGPIHPQPRAEYYSLPSTTPRWRLCPRADTDQWRRLDVDDERPCRKLRSAQMQGPPADPTRPAQCREGWTLYLFEALH
jgi:hypothetical protein